MRWFDHLCELQNSARHDRLVGYETEGVFVSRYDQQKKLTAARATYDDFRAVPQDFQASVLVRVEKAFDAFRRRCQAGAAKKGYPRYKKRVRSLTWCLRKRKRKTGARVRENPIVETDFRHNRLKVPKLGEVKIYMHRPLQGDPKQVTLVKKARRWYAHISCDVGETLKVAPTAAIAVDVGNPTDYLTTSDGEKVDTPRGSRQAAGLLRKHAKNTVSPKERQPPLAASCTCHRVAPRAHREPASRFYRKPTRLQTLPRRRSVCIRIRLLGRSLHLLAPFQALLDSLYRRKQPRRDHWLFATSRISI